MAFQTHADPRVTSPGSIMPRYPWLIYNELDRTKTIKSLYQNVFGAPYTEDQINNVDKIVMNKLQKLYKASTLVILKSKSFLHAQKQNKEMDPVEKREIIAVIAYLQRLGTDIKTSPSKNS